MRVAMVSENASPLAALGTADAGGQNVHVADLSAALAERGHEVTVYTRRDHHELPTEIDNGGYRVVHVPAGPPRTVPEDELLPFMGEFASVLRDRWAARPPDVVHGHFWMSGLASLLAGRELGLPVVLTFHALGSVKRRLQGADDTSPKDRIQLERTIGRSAARVAATCSDEVEELTRMGVSRSRVSVVPCGVDLDRFAPEGPRAPKTATHRIVAVGKLVRRKGFDTIIAALRGLPGTELVIAGGPDRADLESDVEARRLRGYAREVGVSGRVILLGHMSREGMPALLRSADVVVCTPWYEPFGIVPLEAMACGVPVVASAVGGLTDTVVNGVTGRLVPPREPGMLAATLRRLLADESLRQAYGLAGRDRACARYSWDQVATGALNVYQDAVSGFSAAGAPVERPGVQARHAVRDHVAVI